MASAGLALSAVLLFASVFVMTTAAPYSPTLPPLLSDGDLAKMQDFLGAIQAQENYCEDAYYRCEKGDAKIAYCKLQYYACCDKNGECPE